MFTLVTSSKDCQKIVDVFTLVTSSRLLMFLPWWHLQWSSPVFLPLHSHLQLGWQEKMMRWNSEFVFKSVKIEIGRKVERLKEKQLEKKNLTSKIGRQQRVSKEGHLVGTKSPQPLHQKSGEYHLDQLFQFPALSPVIISVRHQYTILNIFFFLITIRKGWWYWYIQLTLWPVA